MLTRQDIENVAARFKETRSQYERVASEVQTRVVSLLDGRVLKSVVTSRAKSVDSLKRSLWRDREKWEAAQFEQSLTPPLEDLAGVRVLLYQNSDVEPARDALLKKFPARKTKDKRSADAYSAYHIVVHEWCPEDDPANDLRRTSCEIQICTIVEHVWNELEHDIKYKQPDGSPDVGQVELLASLRGELDLCARTAQRLMSRTAERSRSNKEPITSAQDLRRYLEGRFNRRVDGPFDELWGFLIRLFAQLTPGAMDDLFERGRPEVASKTVRDRFDQDAAHRDVGLIVVMLLPALLVEDVYDAIGESPREPLWKFMLRVVASESGGKV